MLCWSARAWQQQGTAGAAASTRARLWRRCLLVWRPRASRGAGVAQPPPASIGKGVHFLANSKIPTLFQFKLNRASTHVNQAKTKLSLEDANKSPAPISCAATVVPAAQRRGSAVYRRVSSHALTRSPTAAPPGWRAIWRRRRAGGGVTRR